MISQEDAAIRLREALDANETWRETYASYNPRVLSSGTERVFEAVAFDSEDWVSVQPGGIYEGSSSERGVTEREFRSNSVEATTVEILRKGFLLRGKVRMLRCEYDSSPAGFRFTQLDNSGVCVEWGESLWAEFYGFGALRGALAFAWLKLARHEDIVESVRSDSGAPLYELGLPFRDCCPPRNVRGDISVGSWQEWLAARE